jgi:epoxyqueuosine reductase
VALGNRRDPETLPALAAALHDGSALVRAHAAWALGRIGGDPAGQALVERLGGESDEGVRREIGAALEDLGDANG